MMQRRRNRHQRGRAAMPIRPFSVHNPEAYYEEEQEWRLIAARCPSQAARIWRELGGHRHADYPAGDLAISLAVWQWDEPEPRMPREPGEIPLTADPPGGLASWRGWGLHELGDKTCDECGERVPETYVREGLCLDCASAAPATNPKTNGGAA